MKRKIFPASYPDRQEPGTSDTNYSSVKQIYIKLMVKAMLSLYRQRQAPRVPGN
jgi:hypothetical protein